MHKLPTSAAEHSPLTESGQQLSDTPTGSRASGKAHGRNQSQHVASMTPARPGSERSNAIVFRVQNIPPSTSEEGLGEIIKGEFADDENDIKIKLRISPSCHNGDAQTALLEFQPRHPKFLDRIAKDISGNNTHTIEVNDFIDINIDRTFYGLTQLYPTTVGEKIQAE